MKRLIALATGIILVIAASSTFSDLTLEQTSKVEALIGHLADADADAAVRRKAVRKLVLIGPAALPRRRY